MDLQFQTELTPEYKIYFSQKEEELSTLVDEGGDRVRMALVLVKLAQIQVESERASQSNLRRDRPEQ